MQDVSSRSETERSSSDHAVPVGPRSRAMSRVDLAVMVAIPAPMAILGLLVLVGVDVTAAVCITFLLVFTVTTTMDVRFWLLERRRRSTNDPSGPRK